MESAYIRKSSGFELASLLGVFAAVYWNVLVAEMIGDKSSEDPTVDGIAFNRSSVRCHWRGSDLFSAELHDDLVE